MASSIIELIKILRERTGAGMMDCKAALESNDLDVEKAIDWLREKGIAKAAKKSSRIAAEGMAIAKEDSHNKRAVVLEVNSETDFVARSDSFRNLVRDIAEILLLDKNIKTLDELKEASKEIFNDASLKLGEKLDIRRFEVRDYGADVVGTYVHSDSKIAVLVVLQGGDEELAHHVAMHIAANNPNYIDKSEIPEEIIERERTVQLEASKNDDKLKDKPADVLAKIIEAKVAKYLSESTLNEQDYLLGDGTVGAYLKGKGVVVKEFIRYQVGEGIEKREDNFAEEVMSQIK